jgi:outer membrane lipoprotein-sorting protein
MNTLTKITMTLAIMIFAMTMNLSAQNDAAEDIMKETHLNLYYAGDDGLADVKMTIVNSKGKERVREFTMLRIDNEDGGAQKYYTYFRKPNDVARLTFMVHKNPFETDNRWLYVPSVDLIKRISADDKGGSFVGSDFSYEDVSGRHWTEDNHKILEERTYNEREVYVIESVPKEKDKSFSRKLTYVDKEKKLPLREEYYNKKDVLERVFTAEKLEVKDGIETVTIRKMENVKKNQHSIVDFSSIDYNVGVGDDIFTERYLKNPPRKFIK